MKRIYSSTSVLTVVHLIYNVVWFHNFLRYRIKITLRDIDTTDANLYHVVEIVTQLTIFLVSSTVEKNKKCKQEMAKESSLCFVKIIVGLFFSHMHLTWP